MKTTTFSLLLLSFLFVACNNDYSAAPAPIYHQSYTLHKRSAGFGYSTNYRIGDVIIRIDTVDNKIKIGGRKDSIFFVKGIHPCVIKDSVFRQYDPRIHDYHNITKTIVKLPSLSSEMIYYQLYRGDLTLIVDPVDYIADDESYYSFIPY